MTSTASETSRLFVRGAGEFLNVSPSPLVIAGYAARDQSAVQAHTHELELIGLLPPSTGPMFFGIPTLPAISAPSIVIDGELTTAEVERVHQEQNGKRPVVRCR